MILLLNISGFLILCSLIILLNYYTSLINFCKLIFSFIRTVRNTRLDPMIILDLIKYYIKRYLPNIKDNQKDLSLIKRGDVYTLKFKNEGSLYSLRFKKNRRPLKILNVKSYTHDDVLDTQCVTEEILKYLGPGKNFYGIPTTPKLLGYDNLKFTLTNGKVQIFDKDDIININSLS